MMSKFCKYCGAQLPDEASFCPVCASSLVEKTAVEIPMTKKKSPLLLALTLVVIIAAFAVLMPERDEASASQETPAPTVETTVAPVEETTTAPVVEEAVAPVIETYPESTEELPPEPAVEAEYAVVTSTGNYVEGLIVDGSSRTMGGGSSAGDHIPESCFCTDPTSPGDTFLGTEAAYTSRNRVFYNTIVQPCPGYIHSESTLTEDLGGEYVDHELVESNGEYYYKFTVKDGVTEDFTYFVTYTIIDELFGNTDTRSVGIAMKFLQNENSGSVEPSPVKEATPPLSPTPVVEEPAAEAPVINDSAVNTAEPENSLWYTKSPGPRREFSGNAAALKGDTWYFKFYETEESDTPLAGILATDNPSVISLTQNYYGEWNAVMEAAGTATLTYISDSDGEMYSMDVTVVDQKLPFDPGPPAVAPPASQIQSGSTYNLTFDKFTVPVGGNFGTGAQGPHRIGVYKDGMRITDFSYTFEDPEACELYIDSEGYLMLTNVLGGEYQLTITVGSDVLNFMWVGGPRRTEDTGYDSGIALGFLNFYVTPGATFGGGGSATYYADVIFNDMRITDYTVEVADTSVCTIEVDGNGRMIIHNANDIDGDTTDVKVNVGDKKAMFTWIG